MRKKLDTRFPASRIKKIMQADEDVGKIALAVPVLVSKALELFLQDLCDRTYNITLQRGVKTMSSLHLKQCVNSFNVFDFLRDIVSKVPDLGTSDAGAEDRSSKKRKAADEDNDSDEESKRSKIETAGHGGSARGRGRGRGRGRAGRGNRGTERDGIHNDKCEDDPGTSPQHDDQSQHPKPETVVEGFATEQKETAVSNNNSGGIVRNFDLNLDLDEIGDSDAAVDSVPSSMEKHKMKHEEYPGWSLTEMNKMGIDPLHLALSSRRIDEEEEDYDNEEG